jgi:hypothetical protein
MKTWILLIGAFCLCSSAIAGQSPKRIYNIGSDFSLASNPNGPWAYGVIRNDGTFVPFSTPTQSPDDNGVPVDLWYEPATSSAIFHNQNDFTIISNGGEGVHPANSVWSHPPLGADERWAVVRFTAPRAGQYAIHATFTKVLHTLGNDVDLRIQRNGVDLFSDVLSVGEEPSEYGRKVNLRGGDIVDFLIGDAGDGTFGDATFFDITLVSKKPKKHDQVRPKGPRDCRRQWRH